MTNHSQYRHSDATKAKMSASHANRKKVSDASRAKMSKAKQGRKMSEATKSKTSVAMQRYWQQRRLDEIASLGFSDPL